MKQLILLILIGKWFPKIDYRNGRILFNFTGDSCVPGTNYTVKIIMHCDYNVENNSYPELFSHVSSFSFRSFKPGDIYNRNILKNIVA